MNPFRIIVVLFSLMALTHAESLPRVLILGDSVYRTPYAAIVKELAGKAEIVRPELKSEELHNSASLLKQLPELLGSGKWDLILWSTGIGDQIHRAPGMKSFRIMPIEQGGVRNTSDEDFAKNLEQIIAQMKNSRARLVWLSTTPIKHGQVFQSGVELRTNAIAAKIMAAHLIEVLDMHTHITQVTAADKNRRAPQWETFGSNKIPIHEPMVKAIKKQLSLP